MNPNKVDRTRLSTLTDLPNIGKSGVADLRLLGIDEPGQLIGQSAFDMYKQLCRTTATCHDPCVLDVFISITRFMNGEEPRPWWDYTAQRKQLLNQEAST